MQFPIRIWESMYGAKLIVENLCNMSMESRQSLVSKEIKFPRKLSIGGISCRDLIYLLYLKFK